uniref:Uncharacterized protein n=1 Tax=Ananas comosus var. bracteatus TaxID=296719 RepID=A0A6V7QTW6_ANACO
MSISYHFGALIKASNHFNKRIPHLTRGRRSLKFASTMAQCFLPPQKCLNLHGRRNDGSTRKGTALLPELDIPAVGALLSLDPIGLFLSYSATTFGADHQNQPEYARR